MFVYKDVCVIVNYNNDKCQTVWCMRFGNSLLIAARDVIRHKWELTFALVQYYTNTKKKSFCRISTALQCIAMEGTWHSDGSHRNQNMFKNWQNHHHGLHAIINCTADLHKVAVRQSLEPAGWSKCPCLKNTQFLLGTWPKNIGRIYVPAWPLVAKFTGRVALNHQAPLEWRWIIAWHLYSFTVWKLYENLTVLRINCFTPESVRWVWQLSFARQHNDALTETGFRLLQPNLPSSQSAQRMFRRTPPAEPWQRLRTRQFPSKNSTNTRNNACKSTNCKT